MNRLESVRLLTRYLDGVLPPDERARLIDVALSDQDIYNALAEEAILAEMLEDPEFRARVEAAADQQSNSSQEVTELMKS